MKDFRHKVTVSIIVQTVCIQLLSTVLVGRDDCILVGQAMDAKKVNKGVVSN